MPPLEHILDHQDRAKARLASQYQGSDSFTKLVSIATAEHQTVEDVLWAEFTETLDTATGAALDTIGKIVGQPREGREDSVFRIWIRARVRLNKSGGTPEDILAVFAAITQGSTKIVLEEQFPAGLELRLSGLAITNAAQLAAVLRSARSAGVRGLLETTNGTPAQTFTLDTGPGLDAGQLADAYE